MKNDSSLNTETAKLNMHNVGGSGLPHCPQCKGVGYYFVQEWIGSLQGRRDCRCAELGFVEGDTVRLDKDFNNSSLVKVVAISKVYSQITDGFDVWSVMTDRLSCP